VIEADGEGGAGATMVMLAARSVTAVILKSPGWNITGT
jgi:hypothetical protein